MFDLTLIILPFPAKQDFVLSVAASPDGNYIASGSKDRAVQCWDIRTGKAQFVVHGHKNSVISIAMSEVGGFLATGSGDWQARLFKISGMDEPVAKPAILAPTASTQSQTQSPAAPQPQPGSEASVGAKDPATVKKENGTNEINGLNLSEESSAAPAVTSATKDAPQLKSTAAQDGTPDTAPAAPAAPANAPSSPSSMKIDAPTAEVSSAEKTVTKETTAVTPETTSVEAAPKGISGGTNGDTTMADSPAPQAVPSTNA
jgi:WD40 repeat protein